MQPIKIIIEKHPDGYVAYPIGVEGVVVGEGDTYEKALADVKSAIQFHIETFGDEQMIKALWHCGMDEVSNQSSEIKK